MRVRRFAGAEQSGGQPVCRDAEDWFALSGAGPFAGSCCGAADRFSPLGGYGCRSSLSAEAFRYASVLEATADRITAAFYKFYRSDRREHGFLL